MIGIEVVNLDSEKGPSLRAMITTDTIKRNSITRRRIVHQNGGQKFLEGLCDMDDTHMCLHDVARAAFLLGMSFERANSGKYPIPDDQ